MIGILLKWVQLQGSSLLLQPEDNAEQLEAAFNEMERLATFFPKKKRSRKRKSADLSAIQQPPTKKRKR